MTYIILTAGQGTHLHPLTLNHPKSLYKLDSHNTVLQRIVMKIREFDNEEEIFVVAGYMYNHVQKEMLSENVTFIHNPFYAVTGSMASLWFARSFLQRENVTIINGDVVYEDRLIKDVICSHSTIHYILVFLSISTEG